MNQKRFWPNPNQLLLLHICLCQDDAGVIKAWEQWKRNVNLDDLEHASFRIMSLAYTRLASLQIRDPDMGRIKGIYRYQWTKNMLAFRGKADLLQALADASIPTMLLKGSALCRTVYPEPTARPMHDMDVLVPVPDAAKVIRLLQDRGWNVQHYAPELIIQYLHACSFLHPKLGELDLHWHVLRSHCSAERDAELWAAAVDHTFEGVPTKILCPADQFLHACEHGMHHSPSSSLQWLVDACFILRHSQAPLDWERLFDQTVKFELVLPVRETLAYMRKTFLEPVPDKILRDLSRSPVGLTARAEYFFAGRPEEKQRDYLQKTGLLLCHYLRIHQNRSKLEIIRTFPFYLRLIHQYEKGAGQAFLHLGRIALIRFKMKLYDAKLCLGRWFSMSPRAVEKRVMAFSNNEIGGLYRAESIWGQMFRWSEPEAFLILRMPPGECVLIGEFPEFCNPKDILQRNPQFRINDCLLPPEQITWTDRHVFLRIPGRFLRNNAAQKFGWSITALRPGGKDPRILGLPLFRLWICPEKQRIGCKSIRSRLAWQKG